MSVFVDLKVKKQYGSLTLLSYRFTRLIYTQARVCKFHTLGRLCNLIALQNPNGTTQWASARGRERERVADKSGQVRLTVQRSASAACTILSQSVGCQSGIMISPRTRLCTCSQRCDVIESRVYIYPMRSPNCTMSYCTYVSRMTNGLGANMFKCKRDACGCEGTDNWYLNGKVGVAYNKLLLQPTPLKDKLGNIVFYFLFCLLYFQMFEIKFVFFHLIVCLFALLRV